MNTLDPTPQDKAGIDAIELHLRNYRSALKSTLEININSLINSHLKMESILHPFGSNPNQIDISSLVYCLFRLPTCIDKTDKVVMGQNLDVFTKNGFPYLDDWPRVNSPARRRVSHYNQHTKILACFASSISDIDDLTNTLIAHQIEWNKFHLLLKHHYKNYSLLKKEIATTNFFSKFNILPTDWENLKNALGTNWKLRIKRIYKSSKNIRIKLLAGSWVDYSKSAQLWWSSTNKIIDHHNLLTTQPIYFVSSNNHCLVNIISGFAKKNQTKILENLKETYPSLYEYWLKIQSNDYFLNPQDFLYFASKYLKEENFKADFQKKLRSLNINSLPNSPYLDISLQVIPVSSLAKSAYLDSRLKIKKPSLIKKSNALIFNIDYPLGFAAYHILNQTMKNADSVKGIYILGKAATLNGEIGDIQIPRLVFDEHSQNTYMFNNCFNSFFPFPSNSGSILTNQKAVSVFGTFLENKALIDAYSKNNLTVIEMESGPFLSAIAEATFDQATPRQTIIDLNQSPIDIGIINYTSDNPYSQTSNLGSNKSPLANIEPVYAASLSILQRIINLEESEK